MNLKKNLLYEKSLSDNNEVLKEALIENPNLAKAWDAIDDELAGNAPEMLMAN